MHETLVSNFFLVSRYIHIVATTVLVGGTLFFELVVPIGIAELKTEIQLALLGRMRWGFRWVIYACVIALIATGAVSICRNYAVLNGKYVQFLHQATRDHPEVQQQIQVMQDSSVWNRPKWWFIAHVASGLVAVFIAVALVSGGRPPDRQIQWMRLNLFILLLAIFLASASRGARQNLFQAALSGQSGEASRD